MDETLQETTEQEQTETEPVMAAPMDEGYLPEAGGVAWTTLFGTKNGHVVQFNLTARGWNAVDALDKLIAGVVHAEETYRLLPYNPELPIKQAASAKPAQVAQPAAPGNIIPPPIAQAPAQAAQPAAAQDPTQGEMMIVKIEIQPKADGKTKVMMFAAGRKFDDLNLTRTPAQLVTALSETGAWVEDHFTKPATYTLNPAWRVQWQRGKEKSTPGTYYKDVVSVTPA